MQVGGLELRFYWMLSYSRKLRDAEGRFAGRPSVDENVLISAVDGITRLGGARGGI